MIGPNGQWQPNAAPGQMQQQGAPSMPAQMSAMRGQGIQATGPGSLGMAPQSGLPSRAPGAGLPFGQRSPDAGFGAPQRSMAQIGSMLGGPAQGPASSSYGLTQALQAQRMNQAPTGPQPGTSWGGAPQGGYGGGPFYGQQQPMPMAPQQSVEQSVQTGSPQSVQNFLTALHQAGAGPNNSFQVGAGQQGQGPQAGFAGFGTNGMAPQQQGFVAYGGPEQSSLGFANNYAGQGAYGQGAGPQASGGGISAGGTGGMAGQPGYQQQAEAKLMDPSAANAAYQQWYSQQKDADGNPLSATSDVRAKKAIEPGAAQLDDFLESLGAYSYEYKDEANGVGRRVSPMAQEIESTPLGRAAVSTGADGLKRVDYGKLGGTMLAAQAHLNAKVAALEARLREAVLGTLTAKARA